MRWREHERPVVIPSVSEGPGRAGGAESEPFAALPLHQVPRYARDDRSAAMTQTVLVTDTLADSGLAILRAATDMNLDYRPGLKGAELLAAVRESDALITRSGTAVTRELVNAG